MIELATAALALSLWFAGALPAAALERGTTADGWPYAIGGFGIEERDELAQLRRDYRLRIATAASGSGAYVANVRVRIADASGRVVFDRELDGPILLIDLAPGRYSVQARLHDETLQTQSGITAGDRREMIFYFKAPAGVLRAEEILSR
jgi:hypothetical protein